MPGDPNRFPPSEPQVAESTAVGRFFVALKEDAPDSRPLSDRLQAVEQQIQGMLQRLERVEEQVKSLDARIGGGRGVRRTEETKK
jgi:hypothetical protein